jgi:hypothetical protein
VTLKKGQLNNTSSFLKLDGATLVKIFRFACLPPYTRIKPASQLTRWSNVCKKVSQAVNDDTLWQPLYMNVFKASGTKKKCFKVNFSRK